jgi:aspartyl-tRNA(Asn)/glutamyl-tRNA(Gln) amidotransferase subunit C
MKKLTTQEVEKIAKLSRIKLTPAEVKKFTTQLTSILGYVEKINEIDTKNIEYKPYVGSVNPLREDIPSDCLTSEEAVGQSQLKKGKYFAVPRVIEEKS